MMIPMSIGVEGKRSLSKPQSFLLSLNKSKHRSHLSFITEFGERLSLLVLYTLLTVCTLDVIANASVSEKTEDKY